MCTCPRSGRSSSVVWPKHSPYPAWSKFIHVILLLLILGLYVFVMYSNLEVQILMDRSILEHCNKRNNTAIVLKIVFLTQHSFLFKQFGSQHPTYATVISRKRSPQLVLLMSTSLEESILSWCKLFSIFRITECHTFEVLSEGPKGSITRVQSRR